MTEAIESALDGLHGPRESYRAILEDKDELLAKACDWAERKSKRSRLPVWSHIKDLFGHGAGVSGAIYEVYRRRKAGDS